MPIIGPIGPTVASAPGITRGVRRGASFGLPADDAPQVNAPAAPAEVSLGTLLALQDEAEPAADREARRHAQDLLKELAALHRALLGRPAGADTLRRLEDLCAAMPAMARDPQLAEAVAAIRLRARVELARYGAVMAGR